jgi:hypothetical protein
MHYCNTNYDFIWKCFSYLKNTAFLLLYNKYYLCYLTAMTLNLLTEYWYLFYTDNVNLIWIGNLIRYYCANIISCVYLQYPIGLVYDKDHSAWNREILWKVSNSLSTAIDSSFFFFPRSLEEENAEARLIQSSRIVVWRRCGAVVASCAHLDHLSYWFFFK